ncbi:MAG: ATP-binding cassette domain-containing protein [Congregibacter sp.]
MSLLRLEQASLHFGTHVLLDNVDLQINKGERLGLLGRNGEGKSTLLKVLAGELDLDGGTRWLRPGTRISRLEQELPEGEALSVADYVAGGMAETGELLTRYSQLVADPDTDMDELERVQHKLEAADGWNLSMRIDSVLSLLGLERDIKLTELSGGWRRRAALARALVSEPDILLLDEPTNHLDIPAIEWLQEQLKELKCALVLITHDRRFLQGVADHIAELDRGHISTRAGNYQSFLDFRAQELAAETRANALFDRRLSEEERWIRQGIKARRTRNEGRVRALKAMREERQARREKTGKAVLQIDTAQRSGQLVAELENVSVGFNGSAVLDKCSLLLQRGDRIGIVGPNGAGKSTLIKLITGELEADSGTVRRGSKLEIAYGDQLRSTLDPSKNLIDNICGGRDFIDIGGRRKHAVSYLGDFLFAPQRLRTPVGALSGGEQNRAVMAALFSKPVNLLVLDEPTNDLDIETLELLEELLMEFKGTVILVSHDRAFMDNVVTSLLILRGDGSVETQAGGFSDWEARGGQLLALQASQAQPQETAQAVKAQKTTSTTSGRQKKLSYKEQRELDELPANIETLETRQEELQALTAKPDFYTQDPHAAASQLEELATIGDRLEGLLQRWTELEERA